MSDQQTPDYEWTGYRTKPDPNQPERCPSIDPHDELQCGRRIHEDDQCAFGGIAWKKGSRPPHEKHHPWGPLEAALVTVLADWKIQSDDRPAFGEGSDCSDLMDLALTRIKGLCSHALDPDDVMAKVESATPPENETATSIIASLRARLDAMSDLADRWGDHPVSHSIREALNGYVRTGGESDD